MINLLAFIIILGTSHLTNTQVVPGTESVTLKHNDIETQMNEEIDFQIEVITDVEGEFYNESK